MADWMPVLGPLLGVVIGGGITYLVSMAQLRHQYRKDRQKEQLVRFENIHKTLTNVDSSTALMSSQIAMYAVSNKAFDPEQLKGAFQFNELRMLVDFYAPDLATEIDAIGEEFKKLGEAAMDVTMKDAVVEKRAAALRGADAASVIRNTASTAKEKLSVLARKHFEKKV
jgi:hypothetical protein